LKGGGGNAAGGLPLPPLRGGEPATIIYERTIKMNIQNIIPRPGKSPAKRLTALLLSLVMALALLPLAASAVDVSTAEELEKAIKDAQSGDVLNIAITTQSIELTDAITIDKSLTINFTSTSSGGTTITSASGARHIEIPDQLVSGGSTNRIIIVLTFNNVILQ
jgi:hypothetical protein